MENLTFTDEQVVDACEIHVDNIRKLIQWGAVTPNAGAGGRGRKRLWTLDQVHRICVTSSFFRTGMSLQMAHTLAYCLPLDEFCAAHDPRVKMKDDTSKKPYFSPENTRPDIPTYDDYVGTVEIVNGKYIYSSVLGDSSLCYGYIDRDEQVFVSAWGVGTYYYGAFEHYVEISDRTPGISKINISSLKYRMAEPNDLCCVHDEAYKAYSSPRSYLAINIGLDLIMCVRKLLGLEVEYPYFNEYMENHPELYSAQRGNEEREDDSLASN